MFKLIKWAFLITFFGGLWFLYSYFSNLEESQYQETKKQAFDAIKNENPKLFFDPLKENLKEDASKKKATFYLYFKEKLFLVLEWVFR